MMRVTRGSGMAGLAGIAEASWASFGTFVVHIASGYYCVPASDV